MCFEGLLLNVDPQVIDTPLTDECLIQRKSSVTVSPHYQFDIGEVKLSQVIIETLASQQHEESFRGYRRLREDLI